MVTGARRNQEAVWDVGFLGRWPWLGSVTLVQLWYEYKGFDKSEARTAPAGLGVMHLRGSDTIWSSRAEVNCFMKWPLE